MSNFHINHLAPRGKGATVPPTPAVRMFERLVSEIQSSLAAEVWFDDSDWPNGFDWQNDADAVWECLQDDAQRLSGWRARDASSRMLCRAAGVIAGALRAKTTGELDVFRARFFNLMDEPATRTVYFLLDEAFDCLEQMTGLAKGDGPEGPAQGEEFPRAA